MGAISSKTENRPFILSGRVRNVKAHPECVQLHRVDKFKKAVSILDSPELARYPLAKAFASSLRFIRSLYRRIAAYRWEIQRG